MTFWASWTNWLPARIQATWTNRKTIEQSISGIGGLRLRFLTIVLVALAPVAALSVWQGFDRLRLDQENVRDNLRQSAFAAASDDLNVFASAEQLLRTLVSESDVQSGGAPCRQRLANALVGSKFFVNLARVGADGNILCMAVPLRGSASPARPPWWNDVITRREFTIAGPIVSQAVGRPVLVGILPITQANGAFDGTLNVAIDISWLDFLQRHKQLARGAVVALFDKSGNVVASSDLDVAKAVFARGTKTTPDVDGLPSATGPQGEAWSFAMAPVIRRDFFVGFAMPSSRLFRFTYVHVTVDLLLPVLMVMLASLAIWSATDRLVVKWTVLLQRMAVAYGGGHYAIRPAALKMAPREFRALGDALADMAQAVQERDKRLRDAVEQKAVLIKEIHHRVKNNLQIVMSLLSLQSSRLKDPAARDAVEQARTRVNALALVHRMIYELDRDGIVDLKPLLGEIVEQLHHGFGGDRRRIRLRVDVPNYSANADTAIPLTLFTIEALTNSYKHGFPQGSDRGMISVSLKQIEQGKMVLAIADDGHGVELETESQEQSTGGRLMAAFAHQVGGVVGMHQRDGGGTVVELVFPEQFSTSVGEDTPVIPAADDAHGVAVNEAPSDVASAGERSLVETG